MPSLVIFGLAGFTMSPNADVHWFCAQTYITGLFAATNDVAQV
jgi:hypothetical protein